MAKQRGRKSADSRRGTAREAAGDGSASLALLWGTRARPSRGPKPQLTLDAVVRAAIEVADADGIDAVTMTRVAQRLDVTTMAIYRYVPRKEELVDLMNDHALGPPPTPGGGSWRAEVARWARTSLSRFQNRPWLLETARRRVPIGPNWLGWLDAGLRALERSGLPSQEMISAVMLVDGHVRATAELSSGPSATERWARDFGTVLGSVIGDPRYAALTQVAMAKGSSRMSSGSASPFEFGLERILDGIEARPGKRRSRRR